MGVRQKEMVKARLFRTPFAELRNRHVFLERRGLYRTPHKGQSQSGNPALRDVLRPTEGDFVAGVARASPDEYEVFKRLLAREEEEMEEEEEEDEEEEELRVRFLRRVGRPSRSAPAAAAAAASCTAASVTGGTDCAAPGVLGGQRGQHREPWGR